jgi:hypothetical protein
MIALENLLNIICTEAFEYDGIPEVPDHKHGAPPSYYSAKRDARGPVHEGTRSYAGEQRTMRYDLELLEEPDGTLRWVE